MNRHRAAVRIEYNTGTVPERLVGTKDRFSYDSDDRGYTESNGFARCADLELVTQPDTEGQRAISGAEREGIGGRIIVV